VGTTESGFSDFLARLIEKFDRCKALLDRSSSVFPPVFQNLDLLCLVNFCIFAESELIFKRATVIAIKLCFHEAIFVVAMLLPAWTFQSRILADFSEKNGGTSRLT